MGLVLVLLAARRRGGAERGRRFLQVIDPGSANRAWSQIEHDLVDGAALVSVANPTLTFAVSERSGNVQINPQFGVLLGQVWVT